MKFPPSIHPFRFTPLLLLLCSFLLYVSTFSGAWLMDDYSVIVNNPDIRSLDNFIADTFPGRPLREITYLLDYRLFGLDPWGYHFQNIFWHALNCWLLYLVAIRLNASRTVACLSSLLFLVHPVHVEVVANSSHRKDSLALAFLLLALLSYMKIFDNEKMISRIIWFSSSLLLWTTAFFAKGNSLVFPAIILAYEYALVPAENRLIVRWKRMFPFLCISSAIGLLVWYFYISTLPSFKIAIIGAFVKTENLTSFSVSTYILMLLKSSAFMFSKLILPLDLSMEYIYPAPGSLLDPWVIAALAMIPVVAVLLYRWKNSSPQLFFLLLSAIIFWLPTSNIFWHLSYFAADRYLYAPSAALCILAPLLSEQFWQIRRYHVAGWMIALTVCTLLTWKQTGVWRDEKSLYSHMVKVSPRSLEAMIGLAGAYYAEKNYQMAAQYAGKAMERDFTDYRPYRIFGNINFAQNRLNEALQWLLESQSRNPRAPDVLNDLGSVYDDLGKSREAIDSFQAALKLRPDYFEANTNLGVAFERAHNLAEAETALSRALAANSNYVPAWFNLGVVRYKKNDRQGARLAFNEAVKRDPSHFDAVFNLSAVCKEIGDEVCYKDAVGRMNMIKSAGKLPK